MQITQTLQTADLFIEWLCSLPADQPVGRAITTCNCPIAEWLRSLGYDHINVGSTSIVAYWQGDAQLLVHQPSNEQEAMPAWVFSFVQNLDEQVRVGKVNIEPTAKDCLYVLNRYCNLGMHR